MYSGAFETRPVNHQLLWLWPFSGMRTTVTVAAMLVEPAGAVSTTDYDRQSDVAAAYARWVRFAAAGRTFCSAGTLPLLP
jgi:hypothetical protein